MLLLWRAPRGPAAWPKAWRHRALLIASALGRDLPTDSDSGGLFLSFTWSPCLAGGLGAMVTDESQCQ